MPITLDFSATPEGIIAEYNELIGNIDRTAQGAPAGRAYGGVIRAGKGKLVESIAAKMVAIAWKRLGISEDRLSISSRRVPINGASCKVDLHIMADEKFVLGIECKAYTENAMMKRILTDFHVLKSKYQHLKCLLVQLESMLGDRSATNVFMSYFPKIQLEIITLLEGARHVNEPIHKPAFAKEMKREAVDKAIATIQKLLMEF